MRGAAINVMTEAELQRAVVQLAKIRRWRCYHNPDSRRSEAGFPDLFLMRSPRAMFVELKSAAGRLRPEQVEWLDELEASGFETHVWRPAEWRDGTVERALA